MHINHFRRLPDTLAIAFSGGVDSVVLLHTALQLGRSVTLLHFHHGGDYADRELVFADRIASKYDLPMIVQHRSDLKASSEHDWRRARIKFFQEYQGIVATGHHLNDAAEWYLMSCIRNTGCIMPYSTGNLIKPLIITAKQDIIGYAQKHNLEHLEDPTNRDPEFNSRNRVRNNIMPEVLEINPGFMTMIKNRIVEVNYLQKGTQHAN